MHVSLDSALGRQRRLNSIGETISSIAPLAAAYSLRSLTGGDPKVVRVRRASDNHEQDFTASGVSSGALTSFVNAQVVAPLDIQALSATGRDGDFLIAKAAYSLRSLGTRQATLAAAGDTVARANGKFVAQVRRSSDDALKSFTADEVTDGTLLAFVGTGGSDNGFVKTWYDQSVSDQAGAATGNHAVQGTDGSQPKIVDAGALNTSGGLEFDGSNDFFSLTAEIGFQNKAGCIFSLQDGQDSTVDYTLGAALSNRGVAFTPNRTRWYVTTNPIEIDNSSSISGLRLFTALHDGTTNNPNVTAFNNGSLIVDGSPDANQGEANSGTLFNQIGAWKSNSFLEGTVKELIIYDTNQTDNRTAIEANIGEAYSIDLPSGVDPGFDQVDGFVETWYDQSGNSNDAVQATAAEQPKIVSAGALLADGIDFDGSDDVLVAASVSGFGATVSLFEASIRDSGAAAVVSMGSSASTTNTNFGLVEAGSNTQASVRNTTSRTVNASVSGETRLGFAVTTGQTSTKVGALGGTLVETTDDYGDDFTSGELDTIFLGKIRGGSSTEFNGHIREALVYDTDQTDNRTAIEANIANHYNITLV